LIFDLNNFSNQQPTINEPTPMNLRPILFAAALVAVACPLRAQLVIPSDGSDGAFNPAANIEVDLSQAVTGTWNTPSSNPGKGIYDPNKWAIVFKYSSVNIPAGVTVTFKNHPSNPPVVWLVQGSVNIAGTVSVNGKPGVSDVNEIYPVEGGPGGFRGGAYGPAGQGAGLGIGGHSGHGDFRNSYGNPQLLPLIGGSGGQGDSGNGGWSGSGGGGAILIACPGDLQLDGTLSARAGNGYYLGSGGAVRLVSTAVRGSGSIDAGFYVAGRIRIEANTLDSTILTSPSTIAVPPGITPPIFQADNAPTVRIVAVDGLPSPAEPTAPLLTSADIGIEKNTPVTITLETRNFPTAGSVVSLRRAVKFGGVEWKNASFVSGNNALATWQVSMTFTAGFNTLQARATAP
jgi:hypothetical protein